MNKLIVLFNTIVTFSDPSLIEDSLFIHTIQGQKIERQLEFTKFPQFFFFFPLHSRLFFFLSILKKDIFSPNGEFKDFLHQIESTGKFALFQMFSFTIGIRDLFNISLAY